MSQKAAKKKGAQKQQIKIVDQQKEPCLRAMQKKVRNMNKKLTQIEDLQKKDFLKPEQEEKVSRKENILEEKQKYLELIEMYKGIVKENEQSIRKTQLVELEDLAALIASREYGADIGKKENNAVDNLVKILTVQSLSNLTLKERVSQISDALITAANDKKLKESIQKYVSQNEDKTVNVQGMSNQPEPRSPRSEKEREQQIKEIEEELAEQQQEHQKQVQAEKVAESQANDQKKQEPNDSPVNPPQIQEKTHSAPHEGEKTNKEEPVAEKQENQQNQPKDKPEGGRKKYDRGQKDERGGRRTGRGGKREGGEREYTKKPYKPKKYEPKVTENVNEDDSSSLSATPEPREFKREEVRELIEDGFIVVGKPKIKAKEKEQKQFHNREHGKKFHPHHQKRNY